MEGLSFKLKGKTIMLDFSMMAFFLLGEKWGFDTLEEVYAKIASMDDGQKTFGFKKIALFSEVVECLANASEENEEKIKSEDILRLTADEMVNLFSQFTVFMVKSSKSNASSEGKQKAPVNGAKNQSH
jgi:hypothetical protein